MKVCILSMQMIDNYGSVLQAYSLKKMVEELGHSANFIDIKKGNNNILNEQCISLCDDEFRSQNGKLIQLYTRLKNKLFNRRTHNMYDKFRKNELGIDEVNRIDRYDTCIIGSDEVFNCLQVSKWGFDSQLFGDVKNTNKIITYAACCGATNQTLLKKELRSAICDYFRKISSFSVRDENTKEFVIALTMRIPIMNLDPVAVGNFDSEIVDITLTQKLPSKYCIIYAYQNRICDKDTIAEILKLCEEKKMKPVAILGNQEWLPQRIILSPFEVLRAFQNAEFVITDTFHGTLFGAKYAKKMAVIIRNSNKNKLADLIKKFEIEEHVVQNANEIKDKYKIKINREKLNSILLKERTRTISYLQENI